MSQTIFHERTSQFRFYVSAILPRSGIVIETPNQGINTIGHDAIKFAAVGDVGTCYCVGTGPDGAEILAYEPDLKEWGRECRTLTNHVASYRRKCDECISRSDWQGLQMAALSLSNAGAMLYFHFEKQP